MPPTQTNNTKDRNCSPKGKPAAKNISLQVLKSAPHPEMKKSKMGKWRALVLALVHVVFIIHILQWLYHGVTLSPVEPSESMYTLESGEVNAGFILFVLAIISTLIFGRYFCGWACHVIALQDMCTWLLGKIGIRPKQFRSRLLVWSGFVLALYMFVWPTFKRVVLSPFSDWLATISADWIATHFFHAPAIAPYLKDPPRGMPFLLGNDPIFPGLKNHLIVEDFWSTFPPWFVIIPFVLVCGYATVYFLGSKAFCTYGCPYGGFFGPADRFSIGKIVVNDKCEGCGHCTAACNSNVRVHQEVRDYGMIVDPGCMKCMDCVSVCPNEALSFGFAKPAAFVKPKSHEATDKTKRRVYRKPDYDLTTTEEVLVFTFGVVLMQCYRAMFNQVPMLMAVAMAAIGVFVGWTLWRMITTPNVRLQNLQLRAKGKVTLAGWIFAPLAIAYLAMGLWSGYIRGLRAYGDYLDQQVMTSQNVVFAANYIPRPSDKALSQRAIAALERSGPIRDKQLADLARGVGWEHTPGTYVRLAWLHAVAGDRATSEQYAQKAVLMSNPGPQLISGIGTIMRANGRSAQEYEAFMKRVLEQRGDAHHARLALANLYIGNQRIEEGQKLAREVVKDIRGADEDALVNAVTLLTRSGHADEALKAMPEILRLKPGSAPLRSLRAALAMIDNKPDEAATWYEEAIKRQPRNTMYYVQLAQHHLRNEKQDKAEAVLARLNVVLKKIDRENEVMDPKERIRLMLSGQ